jgi:hypothetical protein
MRTPSSSHGHWRVMSTTILYTHDSEDIKATRSLFYSYGYEQFHLSRLKSLLGTIANQFSMMFLGYHSTRRAQQLIYLCRSHRTQAAETRIPYLLTHNTDAFRERRAAANDVSVISSSPFFNTHGRLYSCDPAFPILSITYRKNEVTFRAQYSASSKVISYS